jgi:hypothetical protein
VIRDKTDDEIRRSSITMAIRMYQSGCASCAESYLSVARSHGAEESEIEAIQSWLRPQRSRQMDA